MIDYWDELDKLREISEGVRPADEPEAAHSTPSLREGLQISLLIVVAILACYAILR